MSLLLNNISRTLLRPITSAMMGNAQRPPLFMLSASRLKSGFKTTGGVKKRFRLRGGGSIKRRRSGTSHNTGYKPRQKSNRLGSSTGIEGKKMEQRIRKMLGCY